MTQETLNIAAVLAFIAAAPVEELAAVAEGLKARKVALKGDGPVLPKEGDVVSFKDRSGNVISGATVLGVRVGSGKGNPTMIKVQYGSGFDANTITIFPAALTNAAALEPASEEEALNSVTE